LLLLGGTDEGVDQENVWREPSTFQNYYQDS